MAHRFKKPKSFTRRSELIPSVSLPTPNKALVQFTEYLAAQFNRTTLFLRNPSFTDLISSIDAAYAAVSRENKNVTAGRARMYLTCHQAFFSAAACISRGVPLDGAAASRRALETARTMLAIKLDPANGARWIAFEERMAIYHARGRNEKPPSLKIKYDILESDEMARELASLMGILSDGAVHFTPGFFARLDFQEQDDGRMMFSEYLETDDAEVAQHLRMLAAVHLSLLRTLDHCCDKGFTAIPTFSTALEGISAAARALFAKYPYPLKPEFERQLDALKPAHAR